MKKLLSTLLLLFFSCCCFAQILVGLPYLKIANTYTGTNYKVNYPRQIKAYSSVKDSIVKEIKVKSFNKQGLVLKDGTLIPYSDIHYLQARTVNKLKTPFRIVSYAGYITTATLVSISLANCNDPGCPPVEIIYIVVLPFWVLGTELTALFLQAVTPIQEFYQSEMRIEYVGIEYVGDE